MAMKNFQLLVNLPTEAVLQRIESAIDTPSLRLIGIGGFYWAGKDFYGRIKGNQFLIMRRRRFVRNSFAPVCTGSVVSDMNSGSGSGGGNRSVINLSVGRKFTFFIIFAVIFATIFALVFGALGIISLSFVYSMPVGERTNGMVIGALLPFLAPLLVISFLAAMPLIGRQLGKNDERKFVDFLDALFRDAVVSKKYFSV